MKASTFACALVLVTLVAGAPGCGASHPLVASTGARLAYVVTAKDDSPAGRAALAEQLATALERPPGAAREPDPSGDGFVVRLDDATRARVASMTVVAAVVALAVDAKHGPLPSPGAAAAGPVAVRIDLFADAAAGEGDAVAAWIAAHGGRVDARGATWLDASLPSAAVGGAIDLATVRWVEVRAAR